MSRCAVWTECYEQEVHTVTVVVEEIVVTC